jgi:hypothetical protein
MLAPQSCGPLQHGRGQEPFVLAAAAVEVLEVLEVLTVLLVLAEIAAAAVVLRQDSTVFQ